MAFCLTAAVVACSGAKAPPARAPLAAGSTSELHEPTTVSRTIVTPTDAASVEEIFARARVDYAEKRFAEAARGFDRIVELDADGPHAKDAFIYSASAHDQSGDLDGAASRYLETARRYPNEPVSRDALVAAVRVLTHLERWADAGKAADVLLTRLTELSPIERIVAYGGKALSLVFSDAPDGALYYIEKGRDIIDTERLDAAGAVPRDLAELYFALGELRRIRGERIHLAPPPPDFAAVLEQRCQLLLDAQSAYSDAMRAYDAHWSAMSGYRVGQLYQSLHEELMRIPPPTGASPAKADLFEGAMRLRYSVLLQKGLTMMEHTLSLAERTGEHSEWVQRAADAKEALTQSIQAEQAALDRLPYSRADLEKALEDLAQKKARKAGSATAPRAGVGH
ncbi:MAG TPA: tetratricopeptide repeat protein [Polyangiaceae bacterium]|nr:tetratricopeptide repeat protein [Polyangiaceae bacterium]